MFFSKSKKKLKIRIFEHWIKRRELGQNFVQNAIQKKFRRFIWGGVELPPNPPNTPVINTLI